MNNPVQALVATFSALFKADDPRSLPTVVGSDDHVLPPPQELSAQPVQGASSRQGGIGLFGSNAEAGAVCCCGGPPIDKENSRVCCGMDYFLIGTAEMTFPCASVVTPL